MRDWVLTTAIVPGRYLDEIAPLTFPLMAAYAAKWEMTWDPHVVSDEEMADFRGHSTAPAGTEAVYASLAHRRQLLDQYAGVVFFDSDNVVVNGSEDICECVSAAQPIATEPACNCAVMVLLSCDKTKEMLDHIWALRHAYCHYQWLEQAAYMDMMGFDGRYPGDFQPPVWLGATEWTPLRADLPAGWNAHPYHPLPDPLLSLHPGGVQPFERRMEYVREYAALAHIPATLGTATTTGETRGTE